MTSFWKNSAEKAWDAICKRAGDAIFAAGCAGFFLVFQALQAPTIQQIASNDLGGGGDLITDSVTPIYDYTFTPAKTQRSSQPSGTQDTAKNVVPEDDTIYPSYVDRYYLPKKTSPKPERRVTKGGWVPESYVDTVARD